MFTIALLMTFSLNPETATAGSCRSFDCSIYSDWKGGCEASSCDGIYRCKWENNSCKHADPKPPADVMDCIGKPPGYKHCTNVAVLYKKRTAGQALDLALARNDGNGAAECPKGFVSVRTGDIDVKVISIPNGSSNGPIDEVEVSQNYSCSPW